MIKSSNCVFQKGRKVTWRREKSPKMNKNQMKKRFGGLSFFEPIRSLENSVIHDILPKDVGY